MPRGGQPPLPLERGRAGWVLAGLGLFVLAFAVAAALLLAGAGGGPLYLTCVALGFAGLGVVGAFLNRGTVPLPAGPIWAPDGLRELARALGWPAAPVLVGVYGLAAAGVLGNIVLPVLLRR